MDIIRVMYKKLDGTWLADSPDFRALFGILIAGGDSYEEAHQQVSEGIPWALERNDIVIEHFVHEDSLPALLAERRQATASRGAVTTAAKR